jgi:futalosine hydrolase
MRILLAAATSMEIQPVLDDLKKETGKPAFSGIRALITGIGLVPATYALMREVTSSRPDLVIQAGIAGSFIPAKIGEVVVVKEDAMADLGVFEEGRFKTLFDLNLAGRNDLPYINGYLPNPNQELLSLSLLEQVRGISVHTISTNKKTIQWYQQNEKAVVESMEGAALHYVCLMENIAFIQFRALSNDIGERDKTKWKIRDAIQNLNQGLLSFINQLTTNHADQPRI